jgi:hypothetical protein
MQASYIIAILGLGLIIIVNLVFTSIAMPPVGTKARRILI